MISLLCRVWPALLEILGPMVPPDRKWVTNEPSLCCFRGCQWNAAKLLSSLFGIAAGAAVDKPIPHDKWDLILQIFYVISVGSKAPTSVLIRLNIAGSMVPEEVMWRAGRMLTAGSHGYMWPDHSASRGISTSLCLMYLSLFFRVNLEMSDLVEPLWVPFPLSPRIGSTRTIGTLNDPNDIYHTVYVILYISL